MFDEDALKAFSNIRWRKGSMLLESGGVATISVGQDPPGIYMEDYFQQVDEYDDLDAEIKDYISRMDMQKYEAMDLLTDTVDRRTIMVLLGEKDQEISLTEISHLSRHDSTRSVAKLARKDLLETVKDPEGDIRTGYKLKKDSDAYWMFAIREATYEGSSIEKVVSPGSQYASGWGTWDYLMDKDEG